VRSHIGLVLQEPFLFSRTIEENIRATAPRAGREEVRHAAQVACVDRHGGDAPGLRHNGGGCGV
jgi:ATP-binding cassette subfamily B protein